MMAFTPGGIGLGLMAAGLGQFFGPGQNNPADDAMPYLDKIKGEIQPYFMPYMNAGTNALSQLQNQFSGILNNPGQFLNSMGNSFKQSPGYGFQVQQGMNAANQAAAAGGMLGTPQHQQQASTMVNNLANQDYYNWLNHTMGLYSQGLGGYGNLANMGLNATSNYSDALVNTLMSQAQLAYAGAANQNQTQGGAMGAMGLGLGGLASNFGL